MNNLDLFSTTNAMQTNPQGDDRGGDVTSRCNRQEIPRAGYVNTTRLTGDDLSAAIRKAADQNTAILAVYTAAQAPLSPSEVWRRCTAAGKHWPLTSVRRAISTLTDAGALTKLDTYRIGEYGAREHEWRAAA